MYKTYTYKYSLNWELKENFALKMDKMGYFIAFAVVRENGLENNFFLQNSDPEGTSPSRRTCFSLPAL